MSDIVENGPVPLQEILSLHSGNLAHIIQRTTDLKRLQERFRSELTPPLADHATIANVDDRILVIQTDSPSWAARLRFHVPELLALARDKCGLPQIQTIRIKVNVPTPEPGQVQRRPVLPAAASRILRRTAQSITDPALRESLLRLSGRT